MGAPVKRKEILSYLKEQRKISAGEERTASSDTVAQWESGFQAGLAYAISWLED